ncbi:MAG: heavy-metal-associated domain-containing protein [Chloroflexi bacterium]|nr:heavy-metal-associated domain-containing protein [Chloroflexota bacterium]
MTEQTYHITGMDCADCARSLEKGVGKLDGIASCQISFTTETLRVQGDAAPETIIARVQELGYDVADPANAQSDQPADLPPPAFCATCGGDVIPASRCWPSSLCCRG